MGFRRERRELAQRAARPDAAELDRRNRESALGQAVRVYAERPDYEGLEGPAAWITFEEGAPVLEAWIGGVLYRATMTEVI